MLGISALFVIGLILLTLLLVWLVTSVTSNSAAAGVTGALGGVAFWLFALVLTGAITRMIANQLSGRAVVLRDSLDWATSHLGPIAVVALLVAAITFVISLVGSLLDSATDASFFGFLASLATIVVSVALSMAVPALVVEGVRGTEALRRSVDLVKPFFWHALGTFALAYLIVIGAFIVSAVFGLGGPVLFILAIFAVFLLVLPFFSLVTVALYVNLRVKSGGVTQTVLREELDRNS